MQAKQRRVANSQEDCSELQVGDSVMMHVSPKPGFLSKLQNHWQGPYVVVKCLQGDQLQVVNTRPERLRQKSPATPEIEEPPPTPQTQQDGDPSTSDTTPQENPAASSIAPVNVSRDGQKDGRAAARTS